MDRRISSTVLRATQRGFSWPRKVIFSETHSMSARLPAGSLSGSAVASPASPAIEDSNWLSTICSDGGDIAQVVPKKQARAATCRATWGWGRRGGPN